MARFLLLVALVAVSALPTAPAKIEARGKNDPVITLDCPVGSQCQATCNKYAVLVGNTANCGGCSCDVFTPCGPTCA